MRRKIIIGTIGIGLILTTMGIYFAKSLGEKSSPRKGSSNKVMTVDEIVGFPSRYKGFLGVEGTVVSVHGSQNIFLLGCEDSCISMPVKYKGQMPEKRNEIVVYGEIKKQEDGRYIFQGEKVKTK